MVCIEISFTNFLPIHFFEMLLGQIESGQLPSLHHFLNLYQQQVSVKLKIKGFDLQSSQHN